MFMFRWILPFGLRREQPKTRRPKETVKPRLEELFERILPSASATPSPQMSEAAMQMFTTLMEERAQLLVTAEENLVNIFDTYTQRIAQDVAAGVQQWKQLLGLTPPASGGGSGSGTATPTNIAPNQQPIPTRPLSGSGTGSGAIASHENAPTIKTHPLTSGSGSGSGSATVSGQVWLDNNGDGGLNNGEMGFYGALVSLYSVVDPNGDDPTLLATTITTTNPTGNNYQFVVPTSDLPGYFEILVGIPQNFYATYPSGASVIDANGFSPVFALAPGGAKNIPGGLRSAVVNTTDDDPNGPVKQNTVTLRDAIQTVINGLNQPVTFIVSGTIGLQEVLPTLSTNMKIDGVGQEVTVQGNGNANNPYSIFTVSATVEIDKLTIKGGYANPASGGGGIISQGSLTLKTDIITGNTAPGFGGGLYVNGGTVTMSGGSISNNTAALQNGGGIYVNAGTLKLKNGVIITQNQAPGPNGNGNGGGMYINAGMVTMTSGSISNNSTGIQGNGGGVYNNAGTLTLGVAGVGGVTIGQRNITPNQGGGMYLGKNSTTTFNACTVQGNIAEKGVGVYEQGGAGVDSKGLNDLDDPPPGPVIGP